MFLPPDKDVATNDKVTLICLVQNFFPADISVLWLKNNVEVKTEHQATTRPQQTGGPHHRFFALSRLEVALEDWERGSTFTCRVVHEGLPHPRTLDMQLSKTSGK